MKYWVAPQGLHVEPAMPQDARTMARMHAQNFFRGWSQQEIETYIDSPKTHSTFVVCDKKRKIAGFMILRHAADESELLTIVVEKKWRNKHLGQSLLRAGLEDLLPTPSKTLFLEVEEENAPAVKLYENFGFQTISKRKAYYQLADGSRATALVMRCDLN